MTGEEKAKEPRGEIGKGEKSGEKEGKKIEGRWWLSRTDNVSCSNSECV